MSEESLDQGMVREAADADTRDMRLRMSFALAVLSLGPLPLALLVSELFEAVVYLLEREFAPRVGEGSYD